MGSATRPKPVRLAEKLLRIRTALGLSQTEMLHRLELNEKLFRSSLSAYEHGKREPPYPVLLKYAHVAGVCTDVLIDDKLRLPAKLPNIPKHHSIK
jgi:transcriptional regulator with XRE-family HTH domain